MKKLFLSFCLYCLAALPAAAQFTIVTGTVKDVNGVAYVGGTISASLVVPGGTSPTLNGVGFTGSMSPIGLDSTGSFTARLADNNVVLPSGTQWKFLVNITGAPPPLGTGPQTCTATLTITGASQSVSSSFSACPALSAVTGGVPSAGVIYPTLPANGGVLADGNFTYDAVVTNGSNVITSTTVKFVTGSKPAKAGQLVQAACCSLSGGGAIHFNGLASLATTTILSVDSDTQIHSTANGNASASGAATNLLIYGDDDTTAWGVAIAAATASPGLCKALDVPVGLTLLTSGIGDAAYTCGIKTNGPGQEGLQVNGHGQLASLFVVMQSFNYTSCTGSGSTCLFGVTGTQFFAFGVWGGEVGSCNGGQSGKFGMPWGSDNRYLSVGMSGWCATAGQNFGGIVTIGTTGSAPGMDFVTLDGAGSTGLTVGASFFPISHSFVGNSGSIDISVSGGTLDSSNNVLGPVSPASATLGIVDVANGATFQSTNDQCYSVASVTNQACIAIRSGGLATTDNDFLDPGSGTTTKAVYINGGTLKATNTKFNGTSQDIFTDTNGTFIDGCGNKFLKGLSVVVNIFGSCSIGVTPQVAGNFADGTGIGTSTFGSVSGTATHGQVTVTYAGTLATPATWTMTFPGSPNFLAAPSCTVNDVGGTNPFPTQIDTVNTPPTTTTLTVRMTFAVAPVATNTDVFVWNCGN